MVSLRIYRDGVTAVTVGKESASWDLDIPLFSYTNPIIVPPRTTQEKDRSRIQVLSSMKNEANDLALEKYPYTKYLLQIESYYLGQKRAIVRLLKDYNRFRGSVMGGATWYWRKVRIVKRAYWYDTWSCPELSSLAFRFARPRGIRQVSSIGSIVIFPREVWDRGVRFGVPEPFPKAGCYYNYLCKECGLDVLANLNAAFWRDKTTNPDIPEYPLVKRIRCSVGDILRRV